MMSLLLLPLLKRKRHKIMPGVAGPRQLHRCCRDERLAAQRTYGLAGGHFSRLAKPLEQHTATRYINITDPKGTNI